MKTQSLDTSIEAESVLVELIRKAPVSKRFKLVQSMTQGTFLANIHAWHVNHSEVSEVDAAVHFVSMSYGLQLAQCVQAALVMRDDWHLQPVRLLVVLDEVVKIMNVLGVPWYLGGSVASSIYGMQQLAQDIDLVVDLPLQSISTFVALLTSLKPHYAFDENAISQALYQRTAFSLLHLGTLMKVDVIVANNDMFSLFQPQEVRTLILDECHKDIPVASAYEMVLFKLYRYYQDQLSRQDGMTNDMEWNDILGMLKVQGPLFNLGLFEQEVSYLHLQDIWKLVLIDAGLRKV